MRVQFVHGLEGSPHGRKATLLAEHFGAYTVPMDTKDFGACVELQAARLREFRPDVLVGSSFGGAVVVELLRRGDWAGPTLLLAQAARHYDPQARLPDGIPVILVHGVRDEVIDIEDSRQLAATGSPDLVRLVEVDDAHDLKNLCESGRLLELVRETARLGSRSTQRGEK